MYLRLFISLFVDEFICEERFEARSRKPEAGRKKEMRVIPYNMFALRIYLSYPLYIFA